MIDKEIKSKIDLLKVDTEKLIECVKKEISIIESRDKHWLGLPTWDQLDVLRKEYMILLDVLEVSLHRFSIADVIALSARYLEM